MEQGRRSEIEDHLRQRVGALYNSSIDYTALVQLPEKQGHNGRDHDDYTTAATPPPEGSPPVAAGATSKQSWSSSPTKTVASVDEVVVDADDLEPQGHTQTARRSPAVRSCRYLASISSRCMIPSTIGEDEDARGACGYPPATRGDSNHNAATERRVGAHMEGSLGAANRSTAPSSPPQVVLREVHCRVLLDLSNGPPPSPTVKSIAAFAEPATSRTTSTAGSPYASPNTTRSERTRSASHAVIRQRMSSGTIDGDVVFESLAADGPADGPAAGPAAGTAIFPAHDRCSTYPNIAHLREALERMYDGLKVDATTRRGGDSSSSGRRKENARSKQYPHPKRFAQVAAAVDAEPCEKMLDSADHRPVSEKEGEQNIASPTASFAAVANDSGDACDANNNSSSSNSISNDNYSTGGSHHEGISGEAAARYAAEQGWLDNKLPSLPPVESAEERRRGEGGGGGSLGKTDGGWRRRPVSLTTCRRLHAGLVPLLSPLVADDEGAVLVSYMKTFLILLHILGLILLFRIRVSSSRKIGKMHIEYITFTSKL